MVNHYYQFINSIFIKVIFGIFNLHVSLFHDRKGTLQIGTINKGKLAEFNEPRLLRL